MKAKAVAQTRTTCPYCAVGCGVVATVDTDGKVAIAGDPDHPSNSGRLCSKGLALAETIGLEDRLLYPEIAGRPASWDEALDTVAGTFSRTISEHGPDSVAFYASGQLLTEDYYVANKLMKGFIGSANIDTNSRLCMASAVAGHNRAFGADVVPGIYEDLELADLVVLVGSNLAWCHPVLFQRLAASKAERPNMKVVLVDPRKTMTAAIADIHLAIRPDGDVALFNGLLAHLADHGYIDAPYVTRHTTGFNAATETARNNSLSEISEATGLAVDELVGFYDLFAATDRTVTVFSQGVNQSASGSDKVNAIINCHLATGRIGKAGCGPFSVTGQPNAMGGREVGGLATMLAAHMDIGDPMDRERLQRYWKAPRMASRPGLKAVDLFQAVGEGRVKALWIMATNPAVSMPEAGAVRKALEACPFVVVSDISARTDTARFAHIRLPAAGWGEKDGTVTNSERRISRQRPFLPLPGEARPDWQIISEIAGRMGYADAFAYSGPAEIFAEHAALSAFENEGRRAFDIGAMAGLDRDSYDAMQSFRWPTPAGSHFARERFFGNGGFFTQDAKARFVPCNLAPSKPRHGTLTLNTGRIRDQWHTMTRTGKSPRLTAHIAEPYVELHPEDARRLDIGPAEIAEITCDQGRALARVHVTSRQQHGSIFMPMHWTDRFGSNGLVNAVVSAVTDPLSGQPAFKAAQVGLRRFPARTYGFAVSSSEPHSISAPYLARAVCPGGWSIEFASPVSIDDPFVWFREIVASEGDTEMLAYRDRVRGDCRLAAFSGERLKAVLFLSSEPVAVSRSFAAKQLGVTHDNAAARLRILAGRPAADQADPGPTVCSCFAVGLNQIVAEVASGTCHDVESVGRVLKAGTSCGSCRSEIKGILEAHSRASPSAAANIA